ncbi:hypothetical protein PUN28_000614 [Cardiocondyla obscurior]|uniref:Uncharacterized protein n=1 Tax=Cardiocondyla obscurior TaxID=286306 RepID=A0AAW2H0B2_9HYME
MYRRFVHNAPPRQRAPGAFIRRDVPATNGSFVKKQMALDHSLSADLDRRRLCRRSRKENIRGRKRSLRHRRRHYHYPPSTSPPPPAPLLPQIPPPAAAAPPTTRG